MTGTYDTSGGGAISPRMDDQDEHPVAAAAREILENAGVPSEINDQICQLIINPRVFCPRCDEFEPIGDSCRDRARAGWAVRGTK